MGWHKCHLGGIAGLGYAVAMDRSSNLSAVNKAAASAFGPKVLAAGLSILALVAALGFMGYSIHGGAMFMTLVENGLAWCL
jgi:hypothetical protein